MGRSYAPPIYRSTQMNHIHPMPYDSADRGTHKASHAEQSARTDDQRMTSYAKCCGDSTQNYPSLAIVTSPSQVWQKLFTPCDAMTHGTLFCELHKPWVGCKMGGRMK